MADDSDDKTEDPTQKRLDDAHARGDVAKSQEVNTWFMIAGATLVLAAMMSTYLDYFIGVMHDLTPL